MHQIALLFRIYVCLLIHDMWASTCCQLKAKDRKKKSFGVSVHSLYMSVTKKKKNVRKRTRAAWMYFKLNAKLIVSVFTTSGRMHKTVKHTLHPSIHPCGSA